MKKKPDEHPDIALVREIIAEYTKHPQALHIELEAPGIIVMQTNRDDHPRVVGASGRNIQAMRTIFQFIAARRKERISLILNEPDTGSRAPIVPYEEDPKWKPDKVVALIKKILSQILSSPFGVEPISAKATTLLELRASKEDDRVIEVLQPALQTIFHAIGRAQGRALHVVIDANQAAEALA